MPLDQQTLGRRLKEARINCGLSQGQAADAIGVQRTAMVNIEAGNRTISTLELAGLAELYNRAITDFFVQEEATPAAEDALLTLHRLAVSCHENAEVKQEVERCVGICREGVKLENILGFSRRVRVPTYDLPPLKKASEAIEQGLHYANEERKRLGLGHAAIADMADLISSQGIWACGTKLADEMSGLFLRDASIGMFILVNFDHVRARKRFSYAHEYAHALFDRNVSAIVSTSDNSKDLIERRANAFASAFLMPETGIEWFLGRLEKGGPSRRFHQSYDEIAGEEVVTESRNVPGTQQITYQDVAALAHHFGVSYHAAVYRLSDLRIVTYPERESLIEKADAGRRYLEVLHKDGGVRKDSELVSQVAHLGIEAFRRGEISRSRLKELSKLLGIPASDLVDLGEAALSE
jgi:Zn-dependent peptidase ImmA (M78 family)/transcriptional regulator with XRE-family HTH domain